ncbi:MAG: hypothetical protein ACOC3V_05395 [bacterium]
MKESEISQNLKDYIFKHVSNSNNIKLLQKLLIPLEEEKLANDLGHEFVDHIGYDAISKNNEKWEYKQCLSLSTKNITITNLNDKEDVIFHLHRNAALDNRDHYFIFTKFDLELLREKRWIRSDLSRGKLMFPLDYNSEKYTTEKKNFLKSREYSLNQIKYLTNNFEKETIKYLIYLLGVYREFLNNEISFEFDKEYKNEKEFVLYKINEKIEIDIEKILVFFDIN